MPSISCPPVPGSDPAAPARLRPRKHAGPTAAASGRVLVAPEGAPASGAEPDAANAALRLRVRRAEAALELAGVGSFSWDRGTGRIDGSPRLREIFGLRPEAGTTWPEYVARSVAADRPRLQEALAASTASGAALQVRWSIDHPDGTVRHLLCQAEAAPGADCASGSGFDSGLGADTGTESRTAWGAGTSAGMVRDLTREVESAQRLQDMDHRKDEFLGLLAHELRNPLAPIVIAAEVLRRRELAPAQVRSMGELVQRQAGHITALIADLMDVVRIGKGLMTLRRSTLDLRQALDTAIEQTRPLMEQRSQQFTLQLPPGPLPVFGDPTRLVQVFANVLNNAAKYTPAEGTIVLQAQVVEGQVVARVCDSGLGIDGTLLPHVFETFIQARRSPDRKLGGLGLGLSLVRTLVELHGGQVSAASAGTGRGSEVTVRLPLAAQAPAQPRQD